MWKHRQRDLRVSVSRDGKDNALDKELVVRALDSFRSGGRLLRTGDYTVSRPAKILPLHLEVVAECHDKPQEAELASASPDPVKDRVASELFLLTCDSCVRFRFLRDGVLKLRLKLCDGSCAAVGLVKMALAFTQQFTNASFQLWNGQCHDFSPVIRRLRSS